MNLKYDIKDSMVYHFYQDGVFALARDINRFGEEKNWVEKVGDAGLWAVENLLRRVWTLIKEPRWITVVMTQFSLLATTYAFYPEKTLFYEAFAKLAPSFAKASIKTKKYLFTFLITFLVHGLCFANSPLPQEERKIFIITGASGELGGATARLLAHNYNLILTGRDLVKLKKLQEELKIANSGHYDLCTLDYINKSSRDGFESYLNHFHTPIAGIVLIAPRPQFHGKSLMQDENVWLEVFQSTFTGPVEALKMVLPHLSNLSKIVVIAGTTSIQLQPEYGPSCVIRRMWTTYTKALSHQLGPQGISINALSPGIVLTNFHQERIQKKSDETGLSYDDQMEKEVINIPLRRHAKPQEVAQTIKFLLSEQSDFINGVNLILDGGFTLSY